MHQEIIYLWGSRGEEIENKASEKHRNGKQSQAPNYQDKSGEVHEKMQKRLLGVVFKRWKTS